MKKFTDKQIENISGAILTSFINLHFLEECSQLGVFKHRVKKNVKRTIEDLIDIETVYFNEIEKTDDNDMGDKLVSNSMDFISFLLNDFDFNDFIKIQEVVAAYSMDRQKVTELTDKILKKNGAKE